MGVKDIGVASPFPTGNVVDDLEVPEIGGGSGIIRATMADAGIPTEFVLAQDVFLPGPMSGAELPPRVDRNKPLLEAIRARATVRLGLARRPEDVQGAHPEDRLRLAVDGVR